VVAVALVTLRLLLQVAAVVALLLAAAIRLHVLEQQVQVLRVTPVATVLPTQVVLVVAVVLDKLALMGDQQMAQVVTAATAFNLQLQVLLFTMAAVAAAVVTHGFLALLVLVD